MTSLITGANGFIGSNLSELIPDSLLCDINNNKMCSPDEAIENITNGDVTAVYHLGAISSTTETNIALISKTNIEFPSRLLEASLKAQIPFVYASSASVYGLGINGFKEDCKLTPLNYYAISKTSFDMFAKQKMIDNPSAKIVGLRYFNVYGHNEDHKGNMASPVHKFLEQAKASGIIKIFEGSENYCRDFIHIDDVVELTMSAIKFTSNVYNIGTGQSSSFANVATEVAQLTNSQIEEISFPEHLKGKYQKFTCSNNDLITTEYKKVYTNLRAGIKKTYEDRIYKRLL